MLSFLCLFSEANQVTIQLQLLPGNIDDFDKVQTDLQNEVILQNFLIICKVKLRLYSKLTSSACLIASKSLFKVHKVYMYLLLYNVYIDYSVL